MRACLLGLCVFTFTSLASAATDLHEAARRSDFDTIKKEVQTPKEANARNNEAESLLISAAEGGEEKIVLFLLERGADINAIDRNGQTPLYRAISAGNTNVALLLIKRGANLRFQYGDKKESILFEAVRLGNLDVIRELIKARPQLLKETNTDGETALFEAVRSAQADAARLLVELGIDKEARDKNGRKARDLADPTTDSEVIKALETKKKARSTTR